MPATAFEMNPHGTNTGLSSAGQSRAQAIGGGIPALPSGIYVGGYSAAAGAVLAALGGQVAGTVAAGVAQTAVSVTTTETTEAQHQLVLST